MSQEKWFVCNVKDFMSKRNTKISNLANINSDELSYSEDYFNLPDKMGSYPLFMSYKLFSLFDPENKGYVTLKSVDDWAKLQYVTLSQGGNLSGDTKVFDRYKRKIQRVCNSLETFKNNYANYLRARDGVEEVEVDPQSIVITISEFIGFVSVLFDNNEDVQEKSHKLKSARSAVHFAHLLESNLALTNYFGTVTNADPVGKFIPCTSSPSLYLEPKSKSVSRGESRPLKNSILYISDSNLYHSSLWSPCVSSASSSLQATVKELAKLQNSHIEHFQRN